MPDSQLEPTPVAPVTGDQSAGDQRAGRRLRSRSLSHCPVGAWFGLAGLWLLFDLPMAIRSDALEPGAARVSLDILALFTLWGLSLLAPAGRALRWLLAIGAAVLLVFRLDQVIFTLLMREEPLLYDQWFMLHHLVVLISDLASLGALFALAGFVLAVSLIALMIRRVLRRAQVLLAPAERPRTTRVVASLWALGFVGLYLTPSGGSPPCARWLSASLIDNVRTSVTAYRSIQRGLASSPYARYAQLSLRDRPDILLFIVESYGRVLEQDPLMRDAHAAVLARLQGDLEQAGWHMVSAYSRSSVSGGRSWIAEGTMLLGTPIRYEAVFQHLVSRVRSIPHLVSFLDGQGYETVLLTPADRNRAGMRVENRYGFDRVIHHEMLGYPGPPVGWGIVPDRYSLAYADRHVLAQRTRPVFFDFHMVTSHAPWVVPPQADDAGSAPDSFAHDRARFDAQPAGMAEIDARPKSARTLALRKLKYFEREQDGRYPYFRRLSSGKHRDYQATIRYDLELIAGYLRARERDGLVIMLGDHQPPVITAGDASFDTPVHVLSRDPRRLDELRKLGFVDGLTIPPAAPAAIAHAGLFSALVRTLASQSYPPEQLPPVLREGRALLP